MSLRQIVEQRSGGVIISTIAALTAGTAIPLYAAGVFDSPPPACYVSAPAVGATLTGSATLTAKCGGSTVATSFLVDGTNVASSPAAPFSVSWNSSTVANGSHTVQALACDANNVCVNSATVAVTTSNIPPDPPVNTVAPGISGGLTVGSIDTCTTGTWTGDTTAGFTYQWKDGSGNISGQTATTYTLASGEIGASIHCQVTASGASGAVSANSNTVGPVVAAGTLVANVWISPTGADNAVNCTRGAAGAPPSAATACATPQKACNLAQSGDVIGVMAGLYAGTSGFTLDNTCTQNITFQIVPNTFADFEHYGVISATNVTLQGDAVGHGVGFSLGHEQITGTNVTWNNVNPYCQDDVAAPSAAYLQIDSNATYGSQHACNNTVAVAATNFTWNGGVQQDNTVCLNGACTFTNAPGNNNPNGDVISPTSSNILIENVTFQNYWGIGSSALHNQIWFLDGGVNVTFQNDKFLDCAPPAASGYPVGPSCDSALMFEGFQCTTGCSYPITSPLYLIQDVFAGGHTNINGSKQTSFQIGHDRPTGFEYSLTVEYTTFDGGMSICGTSSNKCDGNIITGSNISFTGTVGQRGFGACFSSETDVKNVWFFGTGNAVNCGSGNPNTIYNLTQDTSLWSSPWATSYDYTPLATLQAKGENTVCATLPGGLDINGNARPTSPACDAGAVQH